MKYFTFLLLLTIPAFNFSQTIYCLQKDSIGVSFGKINNLNGQYSRISNIICYDVLWSFFNPVNNQYLLKGQEYKNQTTNKLYTINANNGQVVNSLDLIDGNEGFSNFEFNPNDSLIYALSKDYLGVKLGTINLSNGVFTERTNTICLTSFWSALDSKRGYYVFKGQIYSEVPTSKLFAVNIITGAIIQSIGIPIGEDGIKHIEYNTCDSILYALNKSNTGITIGKLDYLTGIYTPISQRICYNSFNATLVPSKNQIIITGIDDIKSTSIKLYTVNLKTGVLISQAIVGDLNTSIKNIESNRPICLSGTKQVQTTQTVLTPNNDGINDRFYPEELKGIKNATLKIYNRWGNLVFESNNDELGWDGYSKKELCPNGVYIWNASYTENDTKIDKNGVVTLIK